MKKLFTRFNRESYTRNQTKRFGKVMFVLGIGLTIAVNQAVVPKVVEGYNVLSEMINPTVVVTNERPQPAEQPQEKIDVYYEEELKTLQPKYEDALHNKARTNAIERVQQDLEEEKESLREAELLL